MSFLKSATARAFNSGLIAIFAALSLSLMSGQVSGASRLSAVSGQHQDHVSSRDVTVTWSEDTVRGMLRARNVRLTEDGKDVKSFAADGRLVIDETRGQTTRSLTLEWGADGKLRRTYLVGGQPQEFNTEAQVWLSQILNKYLPK